MRQVAVLAVLWPGLAAEKDGSRGGLPLDALGELELDPFLVALFSLASSLLPLEVVEVCVQAAMAGVPLVPVLDRGNRRLSGRVEGALKAEALEPSNAVAVTPGKGRPVLGV